LSARRPRPSRANSDLREVADLLKTLSQRAPSGGQADSVTAARLRAAALRAVERLHECDNGTRLHAIATRCDVNGEMHERVAADLGLSRRQFYRDLAVARRTIAREIRGDVVAVVRRDVALPFAAQLQTAAALAAAGHRRVAYDAFAPVTAAMAGDQKAWGHCILAEFLLQDGDVDGADRELARAREASRQNDGAGSEHALLVEASRAFEAGRLSESTDVLERCIVQAQPRERIGNPLSTETLSRALTLLAFCYQVRGKFHAASTTHARNPAAGGACVSTLAEIEYLNVNAMLACDGPAGPAGARVACDAFYEFAAGHGFLEDISAALLQKGGIARSQRRLTEAGALARESLAIHRAIGRPSAWILSLLSGVAVDAGDAAGAIAFAREMRSESAAQTRPWWGGVLHEAEALTRLNRFEDANRMCERVERSAVEGDTRLASWQRRVRATALDGLGERHAAQRAAGDALELLGDTAPPFHRLKGLTVAQRIRPTSRQRRQIDALIDLLGWQRRSDAGTR